MQHLSKNRALVLFSGGQDSTTALAHALQTYDYVETVGFDYAQRNRVELSCRPEILASICNIVPDWTKKLGPDRVLDLSSFSDISASALLDPNLPIKTGETGLPTTFVPGRNLFFFQYAAVIGYNRNLGSLVGGMCQTDFSGYPDCREDTLNLLAQTLNKGMDTGFQIITPLMFKTKAESWQMLNEWGGDRLVELVRTKSHSCYKGVRETLHSWGYGCNDCPACDLRARGHRQWREQNRSRKQTVS